MSIRDWWAIFNFLGERDRSLEYLRRTVEENEEFRAFAANGGDFEAYVEDEEFLRLLYPEPEAPPSPL